MKKILMIAMEFPPVNSTGCYRYLKFIKNLESFGFEVTVVTPSVDDLVRIHRNAKIDHDLEKEIPKSVKIFRIPLDKSIKNSASEVTFFSKVKHYINYKGDRIADAWKNNLHRFINSKISKKEIDVVFVSIPPFSLGVIISNILNIHKIPFIIDFRDEWSLNKGVPFPTYFHYRYAYEMEQKIFNYATAITSVTPQLISLFKKAHPKIDPNKFFLITNGFDFDNLNADPFYNLPSLGQKKYIIGYSGSYYYDPKSSILGNLKFYRRPGIKKITYSQSVTNEDWSYRSPLYFFKALNGLFEKRPDLKHIIEFHHIGHLPYWLNSMVKQYNLQNNFISHGFVNKSENLAIQRNFNALLCTSEKVIGGQHYCLSSKVFDYVLTRKPILAFVTDGIVKEFIDKSGCGIICDPDDINDSIYKLENLVGNPIKFTPELDYLQKFSSKFLSLELSNIIKKAINIE